MTKIDFTINGKRTNAQIDNATLSAVPERLGSVRGFVNTALVEFTRRNHSDAMALDMSAMIAHLSAKLEASPSAVVRCATAWYAGVCAERAANFSTDEAAEQKNFAIWIRTEQGYEFLFDQPAPDAERAFDEAADERWRLMVVTDGIYPSLDNILYSGDSWFTRLPAQ